MPWIVAVTKPNHQAVAEVNLSRQGYEPYCPRCLETIGAKKVKKPLFGPYIFVHYANRWLSLRGTRGIRHVLMNMDGPQLLRDAEIDKLRSMEQDGLVTLPTSSPDPTFTPGEAVRATDGNLVGFHLIYDGMSVRDRCFVLTEMLGRKVRVQVNQASLVAA